MAWLLLALGLVLVVEGLVYALAPSLIVRMLELLSTLGEAATRQVGLIAMVFGMILLWAAWQLGL